MDQKDQKKQLKEAKKAEKLAKLQLKQQSGTVSAKGKAAAPPKTPSKGYNSAEVERRWVESWKENQTFRPTGEGESKFAMVIPPPNITGSLHIGHAMMIAIEDSIVRYKRLTGCDVLFLPGLDHAGIATQNVVLKSVGNVDREAFMKAAFAWSERYQGRICEQLDRMGCSLDYSRKTFTLDPQVSRSVNAAFVELHRRGLIYRDKKIVNWCGRLHTTLSDLEVNYKDVKGGSYIDVDGGSYRVGLMYYVKYYLEQENAAGRGAGPYVVVGTTRPETILGDSAICVNPNDPRFRDIDAIFERGEIEDVMNEMAGEDKAEEAEGSPAIGNAPIEESLDGLAINNEMKMERKNKFKKGKEGKGGADGAPRRTGLFARNPLTNKRIPVIFDEQADMAFGTGVLKVTPAHDPVDFKLGKKHGLDFTQVMDESNVIVVESAYKGMRRYEARKAVVADLTKSGHFVCMREHDQILPFCSRSNDVIEAAVRDQWWMDCRGMAAKAVAGVRSGDIKMHPEEAKATWYRWLEGIRDWCLSRQLWWGHRVPAYRAYAADGTYEWIVAESEAEALAAARERGCARIEQDEDVLDTWFSSGLWPFSTLGWPEKTADFARYFPNSLLETGSDIIFFWVARMVMLSYELCGSKPFDAVLLHGIVRDAHGKKMSKSLGNVIDPLYVIEGISLQEMIDNLSKGNLDPREMKRATDALRRDFPQGIPRCGADALRFALLSYANGMKDINLDILRVHGYSRLCNKIYNASVFVAGCQADGARYAQLPAAETLLPHQRWVLDGLHRLVAKQHECFASYNFMAATQAVHGFFLYDFCDVFLEVSKRQHPGDARVLRYAFAMVLRLFHPFMPFITEDLHVKLFQESITEYPQAHPLLGTEGDAPSFDYIIEMAKVCRSRSVAVEKFEGIEYLQSLVKGELHIAENLEAPLSLGGINYALIQE